MTTLQSKKNPFLGVCLDENISRKYQINIASTKVCKSTGILFRTRWILGKFLRKQLYFCFINSYLNYTNITWVSTNKTKLETLHLHQKHEPNIINFKLKLTSTKTLLRQINAMTIYEMIIFQTLYFMYLCKNGNTPSIFKYIYTLKTISKYTARSNHSNHHIRKLYKI